MRYEATSVGEHIELSRFEILGACQVGTWMYEKSHADGRRDRHGFTDSGHGHRIQMLGALAERVVAKALGIYWPGSIDQGDEADLPYDIEVRLMGRNHYGLRLRDKDHDSRPVVGVVIEPGQERGPYRIPGWCFAGEGKRAEWAMAPNGRPPMYAVPQSALRPLDELRRRIVFEGIAWLEAAAA